LLDAAKHLGRKDVLAILSNQPPTSDRDILDFYGDGAHASIEDTSAQHYMQLGTFLLAHAKDLLSLRYSPRSFHFSALRPDGNVPEKVAYS
jgi:hypothetical protein